MAILVDLKYFMLVIFVLLVGFSAAFAVSMPENIAFYNSSEPHGTALLTSGVLTTYLSMLGTFDIADYTNAQSTLFFVIFLFLILVIMLNLLIAIMSDTFDRVMESWVFEGRKMRVETIIEEELLMDDSQNAECFPEYLQVLRPVQKAEDEWSGVSGQIVALKDEVRVVKMDVARVKDTVSEMEKRIMAEMKANQSLIMEQLQSMALQKADS